MNNKIKAIIFFIVELFFLFIMFNDLMLMPALAGIFIEVCIAIIAAIIAGVAAWRCGRQLIPRFGTKPLYTPPVVIFAFVVSGLVFLEIVSAIQAALGHKH